MTSRNWKIPTVEEYKKAFELIEDELCAGDLKMLKAHYTAAEHTLSATGMAEAIDYANFNAANLRYGKIGGLLCQQLNLALKYKVEALCSFIKPGVQNNEFWLWIMRPQVLQALEELGWV